MSNLAKEMEMILQANLHPEMESRAEELKNAEVPLNLMHSTVFLADAAEELKALGKDGEAKFLWKVINAAQTKLRNEVNKTPPIKKETSTQNNYQKYSEMLEKYSHMVDNEWHTDWKYGPCSYNDEQGTVRQTTGWHNHPLGTQYAELYGGE